jgi:hypothetical protein
MATADGFLANDTSAVGGLNAESGCTNCDPFLSENPLKISWPAPAFALTWNQPWGHVQLHGSLQDTYIDDGHFLDQSFIGGGGGASGDFHVPSLGNKDDVGWNVHLGQGETRTDADGSPSSYFPGLVSNFGGPSAGCYGAQTAAALGLATMTSATTFTNPTTCVTGGTSTLTAANAALVKFFEPTNWGSNVWYQHWWTPTVRSTFDLGFEGENLPITLTGINGATTSTTTGGYNNQEGQAVANLIWSPVPFVDTGFEFFYGYRRTAVKTSGTEVGLDYSFIMKF